MSTQHLCVAAKPLIAASVCPPPVRVQYGTLHAGAHPSSARAFFSRMRGDAQAHKRTLRGTTASPVCMASTSDLKNPKLAELQALKEQNAKLKAEVSHLAL
jgi:hypothetical protein